MLLPRIILHERVVAAEIVGVKLRRHVAAAAPAFVADGEIGHLPRLFAAVLPAQIGHRRIRVGGHVLDPLHHLLDRAAADVAADVGLGADLLAEIHELVRAEMVVLHHAAPVRVDHRRPVGRAGRCRPSSDIRRQNSRPASAAPAPGFSSARRRRRCGCRGCWGWGCLRPPRCRRRCNGRGARRTGRRCCG